MKYKIISHNKEEFGVRDFTLENENGEKFYNVDIYSDGKLNPPIGADETYESWRDWLDTFVGKIIEVEIVPRAYFTSGEIKLYDK